MQNWALHRAAVMPISGIPELANRAAHVEASLPCCSPPPLDLLPPGHPCQSHASPVLYATCSHAYDVPG